MSGKLLSREWQDVGGLIEDLTNDFFPAAEIIEKPDVEKAKNKYSWTGYIVLKYFGEYFKIDYTCIGNGSWTSNFDLYHYKVVKISKVKFKLVTVEIKVPQYTELENIDC